MILLDIVVDQQSSYLVTFENGIFTTHFGNPAENFHLSFIEYKEKVDKEWGDFDGLVPLMDSSKKFKTARNVSVKWDGIFGGD